MRDIVSSAPARASASAFLHRAARPKLAEAVFWLVPVAAFFIFPDRHAMFAEIAILALFALSMDLLIGYAGIVSLGQAAFFGLGAYVAGLLGKHGWTEPLSGLLISGGVVALGGFLVSFLILRGSDLSRLMVTIGVAMMLAEAANKAAFLTGGADGLSGVVIDPIFGLYEFDLWGTTAYVYAGVVLFVLFLLARAVVGSPFGLAVKGVKGNRLRMSAIGAPVNKDLIAVFTLSAFYAGIAGALLAQTTQFVSLDVLAFQRSAEVLLVVIIGGTGYLYGGLIGAVAFKLMHDWLADITAQYWQFWLGLALVVLVLVSRDGLKGLWQAGAKRLAKKEART
ncbi:branched-chain amino acid ABC transporter permease [Segnochrobactraceae bacterium EtOH-i3]